ncbi:hypothetical protein TVAG_174760 [Trichomonas vaginalis G3]|uniref:Uncharacterized protein n=1 Tax=Trichomonas vaginalis (strain ATCC PRA-98 / G3) TaxID=412133 RepID=A2EK22_TRIV3|nr:WD repeat-containing protein family [Trichomonas vaginalis G3]EAY07006.1 hypothetical protein TVAG_174760 [Trichomonas vaginalis G3]KAI5488814.1 WD repeat-containing protein family [Trichomonas vaginalis G3]|eukprot:XP_001319229.1 hypothetical protein [Trichomonas vaginalis G3]
MSQAPMNPANTQGAAEKDTVENMMNNLDTITQSIKRIQEELNGFEFLLNQSKIACKQYQDEIETLEQIKKDLQTRTSGNQLVQVKQEMLPKLNQEPFPKPMPKFSQDGNILSHDQIEWTTSPPHIKNTGIKLRYALSLNCILCATQFSPDGHYFAFTDKKTLFIINTSDGSLVGTGMIPGNEDQYTRIIAFSSNSKYVAIGGKSNEIYVYDRANPSNVFQILKKHANIVSLLHFSPDSERLYSGSYDGQICIWDTKTFKLIKCREQINQEKGDGLVSFALSHDGKMLALGFVKGTVMLLDSSLDQTQHVITFKAHEAILHGLSLSNDDDFLAIASQDQTASVWHNSFVPKKVHSFSGHTNIVLTCCFTNDKKMLITGSKDETIKIWSINTGECLCTINAHKNTIFQVQHHPTENAFLSCSGDGKVCLWDYAPGYYLTP